MTRLNIVAIAFAAVCGANNATMTSVLGMKLKMNNNPRHRGAARRRPAPSHEQAASAIDEISKIDVDELSDHYEFDQSRAAE
jgi:hypothetical protein